jgi:septum formation inhibitor-activating ATPase MinD
MSPAQVLVSLLSPEDSDQLLRAIQAVLPPATNGSIALVRPPEPRMGVAALRVGGVGIAVVSAAGAPFACGAAGAGGRHFVWCHDDVDAATVPAEVGTVIVVAETIDALAWELARYLTGDLSQHGSGRPDAVAGAEGASVETNSVRENTDTSGPSQPPRLRREGRLPPPPAWAHGTPSAERSGEYLKASPSHPPGLHPPRSEPQERPAAAREAVTHPASAAPPTTPLAALARMEPGEPDLSAVNVGRAPDPPREAVPAGHREPWGLGGVRDRVGRAWSARSQRPAPDLSGLGQALLRAHSTVVTVGTPKGGPGKTTEAAAIGVLGARAIEPHGGSAVLVDANLNNPDSWRQLAVPSDALTVREVIEALNRGALAPNGEFARNERLRVLPERRSAGSAYSAAEIARLAQHLRQRHTLIVVDLPNSLPSLGEGPKEALVAHWLSHADVVVLPIDLGEASFIAAGEILDAIDELVAGSDGRVRRPGLVVPLLLPDSGRRAVELPAIAELLDHLRAAGAAVVEVPFTVDVQTASHRRIPIVGASARTDRAFAGVLSAVVAARGAGEEVRTRG